MVEFYVHKQFTSGTSFLVPGNSDSDHENVQWLGEKKVTVQGNV